MNELSTLQQYLSQTICLSPAEVDAALERFGRHKDILCEWCYYIHTKKFPAELISVQGYTAKRLLDENKKALPSAYVVYDFLIFLRENPQYALSIISRGFPIK